MSKSIEQLRQLAENPYYNMTDAEALQLAQAESQTDSQSSEEEMVPKFQSSKGSATVKQIGQLSKHSGDPVSPNSMELKVRNGTKAAEKLTVS